MIHCHLFIQLFTTFLMYSKEYKEGDEKLYKNVVVNQYSK